MKNRYVIIVGSHRQDSQSTKVAKYFSKLMDQILPGSETKILDLAGNPLPLWDESVWDDDPQWLARLKPYQQALHNADGLIVISPEWGGMVPPGLKNFFLMLSSKDVGHKPALIVAVSSGRGGSYPIAELRMSSYKNNKICYLPEHLIIRDVTNVLNGDVEVSQDDTLTRKRIRFVIDVLSKYTAALKLVREDGSVFSEEFPTGM